MIDIAVIQMTSALDPEINLGKIRSFLKDIVDQGIRYVFLPECFYSMSDGSAPTPYLVKEGNEHFAKISALAREFGVYLLGGSVAYDKEGIVVNRALNFDPEGKLIGFYDKMHLFSCDIKRGEVRKKIDEGDIYTPGNELKVIQAGELKIGLGICFDLRFSKVMQAYVEQGCDIVTFSSAFTVPTGRAHWHILNRARAIEGQCFVIAPAQWGKHNDRIITYGHSLAIDPWGTVLVDGEEGEKFVTAQIDLAKIQEVRDSVHMESKL